MRIPPCKMTLVQPQGQTVTIAGLSRGKTTGSRAIKRVEVVGQAEPLAFKQDASGLHITFGPDAAHAYGIAFKIYGAH
jgi:hypothetical protein